MLADGGHQIGSLIDGRIREGLFEIIKSRLIITNLAKAGGECTVGASYLIDIAVMFEKIECRLCEIASQHIVVDPIRIEELHRWQVVFDKPFTVFWLHQVLRECLEGIGGEEGHIGMTCQQEAAHQMVKLLLVDLLLGALGDDAASSDVIHIVEILGRIAQHLVGMDTLKSLDALALKTNIIIIGGIDNRILRLGIEQTTPIVLREQLALFVDTSYGLISQLAKLMELTIARTSLTETHLLHIGYELLHLIVGSLNGFVEELFGLIILHTDDMDEGKVVESLCPTRLITFRQVASTSCVNFSRIEVAIMIGIGLGIQLVDGLPIRARTC